MHGITKTTTNKTQTTNNNCGGIRQHFKKALVWYRGTHMSEVSQPPAGPRIRAV
jgi:hypothetical protein